MNSERQRLRNIRRINKAFGKCRIQWNRGIASVHPQDPMLKPHVITVRQISSRFEVCCESLGFHSVGYSVAESAKQLKLQTLIAG